jgi:hypothetical protein
VVLSGAIAEPRYTAELFPGVHNSTLNGMYLSVFVVTFFKPSTNQIARYATQGSMNVPEDRHTNRKTFFAKRVQTPAQLHILTGLKYILFLI